MLCINCQAPSGASAAQGRRLGLKSSIPPPTLGTVGSWQLAVGSWQLAVGPLDGNMLTPHAGVVRP
jgi:hypothetical protein